jgi:primosomal protein N' (replication factor Y)
VGAGAVLLLHGVTGSGKTFVYARAIDEVRAAGGRAIVLVPEIALTPQTAAHFSALYGSRVGVLHSGLSDGERARVWEDASAGDLDVVVGARSAVFAPMPGVRLIVIDEEHEPSYKQDVAPRYDTASVARERMRAAGGAVVLGSATPSLESYAEARSGAIRYVRLLERATSAPLPPVEIVDMAVEDGARGRKPLGISLVAAMEHALSRGEKVLLFVNRRGYAGLLLCRTCGFAPKCRRCAISLVVHTADGSMRCHVCGDAYKIAQKCAKCGAGDLKPFGFGTQRVEEEVRALFPDAGIVRMDSDTTGARGSHGALLKAFGSDADVLIGTQMIAKGLDFPTVTVVGVVAADVDLNRPDFRAAERTFSLLTQVAGRAGRAAPGARVVVQTYSPEHYAVRLAAHHDYDAFAAKELLLRKELHYPPFGRLAYLGVSGVDARAVGDAGVRLASELRAAHADIEVLGPAPDPLAKARGEYRVRIALKTDAEGPLLEACATARAAKLGRDLRLTVVVDPR